MIKVLKFKYFLNLFIIIYYYYYYFFFLKNIKFFNCMELVLHILYVYILELNDSNHDYYNNYDYCNN